MTSKEALEILFYGLQNNTYKKENLGITMSRAKEIIREDLKALEIIKKHEVNLYELKRICVVKNYNLYATEEEFQKLTYEEFDLLKEWLEK